MQETHKLGDKLCAALERQLVDLGLVLLGLCGRHGFNVPVCTPPGTGLLLVAACDVEASRLFTFWASAGCHVLSGVSAAGLDRMVCAPLHPALGVSCDVVPKRLPRRRCHAKTRPSAQSPEAKFSGSRTPEFVVRLGVVPRRRMRVTWYRGSTSLDFYRARLWRREGECCSGP